jgi:hypothetical protein
MTIIEKPLSKWIGGNADRLDRIARLRQCALGGAEKRHGLVNNPVNGSHRRWRRRRRRRLKVTRLQPYKAGNGSHTKDILKRILRCHSFMLFGWLRCVRHTGLFASHE